MRFIVYMAVMIASVITCSAAKFSYRFSSVALSDALAQIHEDHPGLKINFIYNDLENYKTSSIVKTDNPYEAIRKVIGRNPVSVTVKNGIFYVEAMQHGRYCFRGRVIDSLGEGLPSATAFLLQPADSAVLTYAITDIDGRFSIPCDCRSVIMKITCMGYMTKYPDCAEFYVGDIVMDEKPILLNTLTVAASDAWLSADKSVYVPTSRQKNASGNARDLLFRMSIPQIDVNPISNSVTTLSGRPVSLFINHLEASEADIQGLRTSDVIKVEYYAFPTDPRFRGVEYAVNILVRQYEYGGYTKLSDRHIFGSKTDNYATVFSKFSYKNMVYDLFVSNNSIKDYNIGRSERSTFYFPDKKIERKLEIGNSEYKSQNLPVSFRAIYQKNNIQIVNTLGFHYFDRMRSSQAGNLTFTPDDDKDYTYKNETPGINRTLTWNGQYNFNLPRRWYLSFYPRLSYTHNNSLRNYTVEPDDAFNINNNARESGNQYGLTVNLSKKLGERSSLTGDLTAMSANYNVKYSGDSPYSTEFTGQLCSGKLLFNHSLDKLHINADAGIFFHRIGMNGQHNNELSPFTHFSATYSPNQRNELEAWIQYTTYTPEIYERSPNVIRVNEYLYQTGNPNLHDSRHLTTNFMYTYLPSDKIALAAHVGYYGEYDWSIKTYELNEDKNSLLQTYINSGDYTNFSSAVSVTGKFVDKRLIFRVVPYLNYHNVSGYADMSGFQTQFMSSVQYYWGNFNAEAFYLFPGRAIKRHTCEWIKDRSKYWISIGWANENWNIQFEARDFCHYKSRGKEIEFSTPYLTSNILDWNGDYNANFIVSAIYTFGYGKKIERYNEIGAPQSGGSAIMR